MGTNITSPRPTIGGSTDTWGTELDTYLAEIEAAIERATTPDDININADLDFSNYMAEDLKGIAFRTQASGLSDTHSLYFIGDDLYIKDGGGNAIQVTSSGAINVSAVQGIGGDYSSTAGATVDYSASSDAYRFYGDTNQYADLYSAAVRLYSGSLVSPTSYINIRPSTGFAATSYDLILPGALPSSGTELMTVTSAGVMDTTADPSVTTLTTSSNATVGGNLAITGTTAFTGNVTSNVTLSTGTLTVTAGDIDVTAGDVTVSGPDIKHGNRTLVLGASEYIDSSGTGTVARNYTSGVPYSTYITIPSGGTKYATYPVKLPVGKRIKSFGLTVLSHVDAGAGTHLARLYSVDGATPTLEETITIGATGDFSATLGTPLAIETDKSYLIQLYVDGVGGPDGMTWSHVYVTFDET